MTRDPLVEPRFGDVFGYGAFATKVLYVGPGSPELEGDWLGLALDASEFGFDTVQLWSSLVDAKWEFIETIAAHAITADFSGMSYPAVMRALATGEPVTITVGSEP